MKERTAKILRIFITSDYPVMLEQLEEEFHTSSRTIRNELREINWLLKTNQLPKVKTLRKKGYHLLLNNSQKKLLLKQMDSTNEEQYLDREIRIFNLILSFSLGKNATFLYPKEEAYQISKSTLDENMRRVRNILKEYGIEVLSVPKQGIVLQGSERSIRTMIYDVINMSVGIISSQGEQGTSVNLTILHHYISPQLLNKLDRLYVDSVNKMQSIAINC